MEGKDDDHCATIGLPTTKSPGPGSLSNRLLFFSHFNCRGAIIDSPCAWHSSSRVQDAFELYLELLDLVILRRQRERRAVLHRLHFHLAHPSGLAHLRAG